jgi:hypothetical protein
VGVVCGKVLSTEKNAISTEKNAMKGSACVRGDADLPKIGKKKFND